MMRTQAQTGIDFSSFPSVRVADAPPRRLTPLCVAYSCRGPWGGLEISASLPATDLSFRSSSAAAICPSCIGTCARPTKRSGKRAIMPAMFSFTRRVIWRPTSGGVQ